MNATDPPELFLLSSDLFFPSRIQSTARSLGIKTQLYSKASDLTQIPDEAHLILDMELPNLDFAALESAIAEKRIHAIGYAPHVKIDLIRGGQSAGMSKIYTRGQFTESLADILTSIHQTDSEN